MDNPLIAIHQDFIPIQSLSRDVFGMNDQGNGQGTGYDCGMAANGAFFQDDPFQGPPII